MNIERIYKFGNIKMVNCGGANEYVALKQAIGDMWDLYTKTKNTEFLTAH